jgi:hypothetical protein
MDSTMSDLNSKAAITTAIARQRFASLLFVTLLLVVSVRAGLAQTSVTGRGPTLSGDGSMTPQHQTLDGSDPGSAGFDSTIADRRMKLMNNERRKSLVSDSDKLFKLATELNDEIAHSNSGSLTPEQLRKVAEIEKLARNVRDKMTMTLPAPSSGYFPINGPPFSQ